MFYFTPDKIFTDKSLRLYKQESKLQISDNLVSVCLRSLGHQKAVRLSLLFLSFFFFFFFNMWPMGLSRHIPDLG